MANGAAAGAAAAIASAIKASGVIVRVTTPEFGAILKRAEKPLVIHAQGGFFSPRHQYLVSYKGFAFHTKSATALVLPPDTEVVEAEKIWVP
jgi:glycogen synthase